MAMDTLFGLAVLFLLPFCCLGHDVSSGRLPVNFTCPCQPAALCRAPSERFRRESFGFLDFSPPFIAPDPNQLALALSGLSALVLSHDATPEPVLALPALQAALPKLLCAARRRGVRLFYRLQVSEDAEAMEHLLKDLFAPFPFEGISLRLDEDVGRSPHARNVTARLAAAARKLRPEVQVMLEQSSLRCAGCDWMRAELGHNELLFLPAFPDNDCPNEAFDSAAAVAKELAPLAASLRSRLVLGVALFGLEFDCLAITAGRCNVSSVCPSRFVPHSPRRPLGGSSAPKPDGHFTLVHLESRHEVLTKLGLVERFGLAGFGLVRVTDLASNSSAAFWREVARVKGPARTEDSPKVFYYFLLFVLLVFVFF